MELAKPLGKKYRLDGYVIIGVLLLFLAAVRPQGNAPPQIDWLRRLAIDS